MTGTTAQRWIRGRLWAVMAIIALTLAACGGGDEGGTAGVAAGGSGSEAAGGATAPETSGSEASSDIDIDLSGVSFVASSSQPGALGIPLFYAFDLLRQWGAEIEVVTLTNTPGIQALVAGRTQLAPHGADELLLGKAQGANPVAIGASEAKQGYVLAATTDIEEVGQLQGKTIGMSGPAGFDALLSRFALEDAGLDPQGDVNFVQVGGSPDRAAALLNGNVDAATIFVDDWYELERQADDVHIIVRMAEVVPDYPATVYFGLEPYISENPDLALAIACANLESNKWAQDDREGFIDFGLELMESATPEAIGDLYDFAMEVGMYPTDPSEVLSTDGMDGLMEAMLETGDIANPVDVTTVVDTSYLEEAAEMGCGQ